jgi:predicted dehydrogenase
LKLKIGLVGVGHLGKIHLRILLQLKEYFDVVGFYDPNIETADQVAKEFGVTSFVSSESLLSEVEVLDVVSPTPNHFQYAEMAIQKGVSVFIEKPLTETLEEAKKLQKLLLATDLTIQVGHVERFNPAFLAAEKHIQNPMFIEAHRLSMFNPRGTDVPVVLDLMIHDIDIILRVVKSKVKNVAASGVSVVSDSPDIANARLEFENGCVANLTASRLSLKNMRKARFFQQDAYVSVDFLNKELEVVRLDKIEGEADPFDLILPLGEGKNPRKLTINKPNLLPNNAIEEELKSFHQSVVDKSNPVVSLSDGLQAMEVAHLIMEKLSSFQTKI